MKNWGKVIVALVVIIAIVAVVFVVMNNKKDNEKVSLKITSAKDLSKLVEEIYEKVGKPFPTLETTEIDVSDETMVNSVTGLEDGDDFEYLVVSEPMISSQAYSFVLAKVKSGVNADNIAKKMMESVNPRKWICVSAEKVSATSSGDIVCLVMTEKDKTDEIMNCFKEKAGTVRKVYSEDVEDEPFEDDMPAFDIPGDFDIDNEVVSNIVEE